LKQAINKGGGGSQPPSPEIITYSPSKFLTRVGTGETIYTTTHAAKTKTNANANANANGNANANANTTTKASGMSGSGFSSSAAGSHSYYVVKAGSLGSAASMSGSVKVSTPPKVSSVSSSASASVSVSASASSTASSTISAQSESSFCNDKMEHSYMRDPPARSEVCNGLAPARNILVRHPPQCPSCHTYPAALQQHEDAAELNQAHVPPYDEIAAKEAMGECARIAKYVKNSNSDDQDWVARINQFGWTPQQLLLFEKVTAILDQDQLSRLANDKRQHEAIQRRVSIDKAASRLRKALASVAWDQRMVQWLHLLLMEYMSPSYMASYLDVLQTLNAKLPTLVDKMLFSRPTNVPKELLSPVMTKRWEPIILTKNRQLTHNAILVVLPTMPISGQVSERMQRWYQALATITQVDKITLPNTNNRIGNQNLDQVAETIVSLTRVRIHELRTENPNRGIILIGFNAGSALALQVALSESVACVVCMGFAYNTSRGPRGSPDDRMLDIKAPILFVIGQNSARTSQEEMEGLRERMQSESSLVVVGSADDALRVPKSKRRIESVTQSMVDAMVVDEIYDFVSRTLSNPPGPRMPTTLMHSQGYQRQQKPSHILADGNANKAAQMMRKRKIEGGLDDGMGGPVKSKFSQHSRVSKPKPPRLIDPFAVKRKVGRPRTRPLPKIGVTVGVVGQQQNTALSPEIQPLSNDELNQYIEFIPDESQDYEEAQSIGGASASGHGPAVTAAGASSLPKVITPGSALSKHHPTPVNLAAGTKIKMIPSNQFVHIKTLPSQTKLINYTMNKPGVGASSNPTGGALKAMPGPSSGQQVYTLKTPSGQTTQFASAGAVSSATGATPSQGQQKYTVFKNANGMTMLQLTKNVATPSTSSSATNMDLSNIIDMPIVFADNEGNIAEQQQQKPLDKPGTILVVFLEEYILIFLFIAVPIRSGNKAPLIISQKIIKEANKPPGMVSTGTIASAAKPGTNIVINKNLQQLFTSSTTVPGQNKVVYLNRNSIKPVTGAHRVPIRIMSNPKTGGPSTLAAGASGSLLLDGSTGSLVPGIKTVNVQTIKPGASQLSAGAIRHTVAKPFQQFQVINSPAGSSTVASEAKPLRNIYFKAGHGMKPVQMVTNRVASGSVTTATPGAGGVRRLVNIGPVSKLATGQTVTDSKVIKLQATPS
ncbi:hypothetical protein KR018_010001, partial [Drosophila ironensis]